MVDRIHRQVGQELDHGPAAGDGGGHGLGTGVSAGQPGLVPADEPPQLMVAADLARPGIVDHYLARPHGLQGTGVTMVQRGEVPRDRIGLTGGTSLKARQLNGTSEVREPRHLNPRAPFPAELPLSILRQPPHGAPGHFLRQPRMAMLPREGPGDGRGDGRVADGGAGNAWPGFVRQYGCGYQILR